MIYEHILLITFLNEPELIFCTQFQVFLSNMNNSIQYQSFELVTSIAI